MQTPSSLLTQILDAAVPLVVTLVGILFSWLTATIRSKVKSEQARGMLLRLSEQARDVVLELEQSVVTKLRELSADGKLDASDVKLLNAQALDSLKAQLGKKGRADALKVLGFKDEAELEQVLRVKLEAEVAKAKAALAPRLGSIGTVNVSGV
jgi:hypothetical protein